MERVTCVRVCVSSRVEYCKRGGAGGGGWKWRRKGGKGRETTTRFALGFVPLRRNRGRDRDREGRAGKHADMQAGREPCAETLQPP